MEVLLVFKNFNINSLHRTYKVEFMSYLEGFNNLILPDDFILIDKNILAIYPDIHEYVNKIKFHAITPSENAKSFDSIGDVINILIESGFSKNNRLIAIGGGVTQDITSFIASILFRGVDWIFFPTNLATQCDSCIGSKNTVNINNYKNQLGGFHPPSNIVIDYNFCNTISDKEISSGLGEMMHYFLVDGVDDLESLHKEIIAAKQDKKVLASLVQRSLSIKAPMVELDEFDKGPRNVFNYGHSFGHALESATDYKVPHGVAVAFGMDLANIISSHLGFLDIKVRNNVNPLLQTIWEDTKLPDFCVERYFHALSKDKKNVGNEVKVILTKGLGKMFKTTLPMTNEIKELIKNFYLDGLYNEQR